MKKFYSLVSVILLGAATTFGQVASTVPLHKSKAAPSNELKLPVFNNASAARQGNPQDHSASIIWSDDFSTGANWTIASGTAGSDNWVIGTGVPSGGFAIPGITSTTAANGFALYDSDLMCGGDQIGNLTNATAINCSGHPTVRITFEEYYRKYVDSTYLYVSNDGVNWTLFPVNAGLALNAFTPTNPTVASVNISSVAGNQATVYIRFTFYSPASLGTGAGCGYAWMVDDVVLDDLPADNCAMLKAFPSQYTVVPLSQSQPIDLAGRVTNVGVVAETNVGFNANVFVYDWPSAMFVSLANQASATAATLNPGDTSAVLSAGSFTPPDTGYYAFQYILFMDNTDADNSNDTSLSYYYVSDTTYARDNAALRGGSPDLVIQYNAGGAGSFGVLYDAYSAVTVTSVSTIFYSHNVGDQLTASIYSITGGVPDLLLGSSAVFTTTAADTGGIFMSFELVPPVSVNAGQFAASMDQITTNPIGFWMNNDVRTPSTTFFGGAGTWGLLDTVGASQGPPFFPQTLAIRANIQLNTAVNEQNMSTQIDIFPNPSSGKLYIHNSGQKDNMIVTVYNSVGQSVYTGSFSQMANAVVDLSGQATGVYSVQIKSDKDITTKSVVITSK